MSTTPKPLTDSILLNQPFFHYKMRTAAGHDRRLRPLGKINIFVGANNSGKSRALRLIAQHASKALTSTPRLPEDLVTAEQSIDLWTQLRNMCSDTSDLCRRYPCQDAISVSVIKTIEGELKHFSDLKRESFNSREASRLVSFLQRLKEIRATDLPSSNVEREFDSLTGELERIGSHHLSRIDGSIANMQVERKRIYVPILRSLRHLSGDDFFHTRTKEQYFKQANDGLEIFTGQSLYKDVTDLLLGDLRSRRILRNFEGFLSEKFFRGAPIVLIPRQNQHELWIKIGEEEERPVHELGDGIQSIITLIFPLFRDADTALTVLIEEPELFLHPWLQRVLLELLSNQFPEHQYFLTTHSNHLLDLTVDINDVSVFVFEKELQESGQESKEAHFLVTNVSRDSRRPLELLGVRNSSVLLTNCTIWVEGITDRRYLAHWLELYQRHLACNKTGPGPEKWYHEDLHYSFVEYGGGNITHWSFLDDVEDSIDVCSLCGKIFLITDKDTYDEGKKAERHANLEECLGDRYFCLPAREIENLLPPSAILAVLKYYGDTCRDAVLSQSDYREDYLGTFIEESLVKAPKQRIGRYAAKSGTVTAKVKFCHLALTAMNDWKDLTDDARGLTERVYRFIQRSNTD